MCPRPHSVAGAIIPGEAESTTRNCGVSGRLRSERNPRGSTGWPQTRMGVGRGEGPGRRVRTARRDPGGAIRGRHLLSGNLAGLGLDLPAREESRGQAAATPPHETDPLPDEKGKECGGSGMACGFEFWLGCLGGLLVRHGSPLRGSGVHRDRGTPPPSWKSVTSVCPSGHLPSCPWPWDRRRGGGR